MMTGKPTAPELLATLREKLVVSLDRLASTWFQEHPDPVVGTETSMADVTLAVMLNHLLTGTDYDLAAHPKVQHFREAAQKNPLLKLD
jgi:glutathione S-transferase